MNCKQSLQYRIMDWIINENNACLGHKSRLIFVSEKRSTYKLDFDSDRASHPYKYWKAFGLSPVILDDFKKYFSAKYHNGKYDEKSRRQQQHSKAWKVGIQLCMENFSKEVAWAHQWNFAVAKFIKQSPNLPLSNASFGRKHVVAFLG